MVEIYFRVREKKDGGPASPDDLVARISGVIGDSGYKIVWAGFSENDTGLEEWIDSIVNKSSVFSARRNMLQKAKTRDELLALFSKMQQAMILYVLNTQLKAEKDKAPLTETYLTAIARAAGGTAQSLEHAMYVLRGLGLLKPARLLIARNGRYGRPGWAYQIAPEYKEILQMTE